jgi:hypothetical protein
MSEVEQEIPNVGLADIKAVIQIIDIVSKRGAFEGPELAEVGAIRNKLELFLKYTVAKQQTESLEEEDELKSDDGWQDASTKEG